MSTEASAHTIFTAARTIYVAMQGKDLGALEGIDAVLTEDCKGVIIYCWFFKGVLDPVYYQLPSPVSPDDFDPDAASETFKAVLLSVSPH